MGLGVISLSKWATRFDPAPHRNTLHKWAKSGAIIPAPIKAGKGYYVDPSARLASEICPMGRRRTRNLDLPPNLYCQDGYYYWRNPNTRKVTGAGRDKHLAITQGIAANLHLQAEAVTIVDRITGAADRTVAHWCDEFSRKHPSHRIKYLREGLGKFILARLEPLQINDWLSRWDAKPTMRKQQLGLAKTVFAAAVGSGWLKTNPARELTTETPVTQRHRLTLDAYKAIHAKASPPLQRAMEIALMAPMRRADVLSLQWAQVKEGHVWIQHPDKGGVKGMKVRLPLSLHLAVMGWTLGDVIGRCRDNVVSRYVIHHQRTVGMAKAGDKFRDKTIEQMFRDAREAAGINMPNPPTFHEIRSLAARLWDAQGVNVKVLLGHRTEGMSALYKDSRGAEWVTL